MLLYYVFLLFVNLLCCALLLFVSTSLLCDLVVHQHLLAMCSWCSPMPPHCVVHSCCLFVPPYYVFLMFVNIFLLYYYYSWALFYRVLLLLIDTSLLCVSIKVLGTSLTPSYFLSTSYYVVLLFFNASLSCILGVL